LDRLSLIHAPDSPIELILYIPGVDSNPPGQMLNNRNIAVDTFPDESQIQLPNR